MVKLGADVCVQDSKKEEEVDPQLRVFLKDRNIKCYWNDQHTKDMSVFDMLILESGVPPRLDFIDEAKKHGAEIIGELEIAYRVGKGNYVAITGTNGKTTTTTLVGEIYKAAGKKKTIFGNIEGQLYQKRCPQREDSWLITETSSFQLETIKISIRRFRRY